MQNVREEQTVKVRILGLQLLNAVGPAALKAAVDALRAELAHITPPPPSPR
jgi:rare lipoprotein A